MADDRSSKDSDKLSPLERYLAKQKAEKAALAAKTAPPAAKSRLAKLAGPKADAPKATVQAKPAQPENPLGKKVAFGPNERPTLNGIQRPEPLQPPSLSRWESVAESRLSETEQRAREAGAPAAPPPRSDEPRNASTPTRESNFISPGPTAAHEDIVQPITDRELQPDGKVNADFGPRFIAAIIDGCILITLSFVAKHVVLAVLAVAFGSVAESHRDGLEYLTSLCMTYAYYGYFYPVKGASPGKLMLGLEVLDTDGVTRLTPWKAFFREAIGKVISAIPFMMGYIIVLIRGDHRALHDLLFDTRVIKKSGFGI